MSPEVQAILMKVAEAVVTIQRDWGDRTNRKHARLKYTIDDRGADAFRAEIAKRAGKPLEKARPFKFTSTGDRYGWTEDGGGDSHVLNLSSGFSRGAFNAVGGLSNEVKEKLARVRPRTLGQAGRIEGMTPGALTALLAYVKRKPRVTAAA